MKPIEELAFEDLRVHYGTGRSILLSGNRQEKKYEYRVGMMTNVGDIERSEWIVLAKQLIEKANEQDLYLKLLEWETEHNYCRRKTSELEENTLELHMARIFDDPKWVDFILFNRKYRPEVLENADLVWFRYNCCGKVMQTTRELYESMTSRGDNTIYCRCCGEQTSISPTDPPEEGGKTYCG